MAVIHSDFAILYALIFILDQLHMQKKNTAELLAKQRYERIQYLLQLVHLNEIQLVEYYQRYGITPDLLVHWKSGKGNELTHYYASLLAWIFQEKGLQVTAPWIMFGAGENPTSNISSTDNLAYREKQEIHKELEVFRHNIPLSLEAVISDDALSPWLRPGDYVAGEYYNGNDMEKAIGHPCIVKTEAGEIFIRIVKAGNDIELYNLICSNPETTVQPVVLEDVKLIAAAPILWVRKSRVNFYL